MKKRPINIFDAMFGTSRIFSNSLFSDDIFSLSSSESNFPGDNDVNFNKTEETAETDTHVLKKEIWTSIDGNSRFERSSTQSKKSPLSISPPTKKEIKLLLDKAVEKQDFEEAIKLRDQLKESKD